ncbi:MAG: DUF1211 domain-containing protein [Saprospiraceae bacterium]|nr:DUF1211 domain-containing protein [Saprospiraceae bacterium]
MNTGRLEAFSDGVIAIIITIMVLELKVPEGSSFSDLTPLFPKLLSYLLSFIYVGLYWNNHHHFFHAIKKVNGKVLWANLGFLFTLSLLPATTAWMGENHFASNPVALYGINLLLCAITFFIIEYVALKNEGKDSQLGKALKNTTKENLSWIFYVVGIILVFFAPKLSVVCYALVALIWIIPDKRIEKLEK